MKKKHIHKMIKLGMKCTVLILGLYFFSGPIDSLFSSLKQSEYAEVEAPGVRILIRNGVSSGQEDVAKSVLLSKEAIDILVTLPPYQPERGSLWWAGFSEGQFWVNKRVYSSPLEVLLEANLVSQTKTRNEVKSFISSLALVKSPSLSNDLYDVYTVPDEQSGQIDLKFSALVKQTKEGQKIRNSIIEEAAKSIAI